MTREEAIIDIKENIKPIVGGKSLEFAILDMEKQIPVKVKELNEAKDLYVAECTKCNYLVYRNQKYCDGCGQKLGWGDN
jgi:hypothetical protein